jgi:hypothetical protein
MTLEQLKDPIGGQQFRSSGFRDAPVTVTVNGAQLPIMAGEVDWNFTSGHAVVLTTAHGIDCDGYRTTHYGVTRQVSREGRGMWRASCEYCNWNGTLVGPDARELPAREASVHSAEVPCTGQCAAVQS